MTARTFSDEEVEVLAWLVNNTLNPIGYHLVLIKDGDTPWWMIVGDGSEYCHDPTSSADDMFYRFKRLLKEADEQSNP